MGKREGGSFCFQRLAKASIGADSRIFEDASLAAYCPDSEAPKRNSGLFAAGWLNFQAVSYGNLCQVSNLLGYTHELRISL
jgi:hypothetical protein